jgi:rod shape-determining protein MreD
VDNIRFYKIALALIALAVLQATCFSGFLIMGGIKPDLLLTATVFFGLYGREGAGIKAGILSGFLSGAFSGVFMPLEVFLYAFVGFLAGYNSNRFYRDAVFVQMFLSFLAVIIAYGLFYAIAGRLGGKYHFERAVSSIIVPAAFFSSLTAPFVFFALKRTVKRGYGR